MLHLHYHLQNINLPEGVFQRFQQAKDLMNQKVNSLTESAQQVGESLKERARSATDQAIDTVTTTLGQAKASVEGTLQTAEQIKTTTTVAVKTAMISSVNDWLTEHPVIFQLVKILGWACNHPIISLVILLFALAIFWSIIRVIGRFIESATLSVLQVPFKLIQAVIQFSFSLLNKGSNLAIQRFIFPQKPAKILALPPATSQPIHKDKQQRLVAISNRLEEIQKEQKLLLQEAAKLLDSDKVEIKM
ncbi:MAG: hypothetical protein DSM106950_22805 [Stigonema ocellatum SAG 48.90 = DSM 106950]|nr:hypothetical protein [Stigonema ocellatum SAG 48.90 = DSM 106950]